MRRGFALPGLALALVVIACGGGNSHAPVPGAERLPMAATARPSERNLAPVVSIGVPGVIHAGLDVEFTVLGRDPDDSELVAAIDFGDGSPRRVTGGDTIAASYRHLYARPGAYTVVASLTDPRGATSVVEREVDVLPRKVLFVQGYGSESRCPDGGGFASRVAAWAPALLEGELVPVAGPGDLVYASYSGRWCDGGDGTNGAFADYNSDDTCNGIDSAGGIAERLRAQVEALAPARVTVIGHSMGGLAAAWLVGSDPDWARRHIASVVTFDSPLAGVPTLNMAVLRIGGECGFGSDANDDLSDRNQAILAVVAGAGGIVPFYNLDATDREGVLFIDLRQPVPSDRTHLAGEVLHWQLATTHNGIWNQAPGDASLGPVVRAVVGCAIALLPGRDCLIE
jgi:pimeloyl-ACP methyl ester carboxylesterase